MIFISSIDLLIKKMVHYDLNFDKVESNENWLELSAKDENVEFNIKIRRN